MPMKLARAGDVTNWKASDGTVAARATASAIIALLEDMVGEDRLMGKERVH